MDTIDFSNFKTVTDSSKDVSLGGVFVAIKGYVHDGHNYIQDAINNGAKLIVIDKDSINKKITAPDVSYIEVNDTRKALSYIASKIYKQPDHIVAITGTNGKTSATYFYKQILEMLGQNSASLGTLGAVTSTKKEIFSKYDTLTTPSTIQLYSILNELKACDINNMAMEVSSHGLSQSRVDNVNVEAAAFTSFSQDHLDYHKNMEEYFKAKMKLFEEVLPEGSPVVINADMDVYVDV